MNRRLFLATAANSLAAGPAIVVGLIGAGYRGMQLLQACLAEASVRVGAVCETYEPRMFRAGAAARGRGHKCRYYRLYRDLIADDDIDAVIVATPDFSHHTITLEALKADKHVYVEQPLCLSWPQGVELLKAERESKCVVQVGSQRRSSSVYLEAAKRISRGVRTAHAHISSRSLREWKPGGVKLPEPLNFFDWQAGAAGRVPLTVDRFLNWRYYPEYGGGAVADLGCHVLDGIHMLTGATYPISVKASGVPAKDADTIERASIAIEYPGGLSVSLALNAAARDEREIITVERERVPRDTGGQLATRAHIANFVNVIRSHQLPRAPIHLTFAATLTCQMANLSIRSGRSVRWNATDQRIATD